MTEPTGVSARRGPLRAGQRVQIKDAKGLSLIHISEPTRLSLVSRMPSSA